MNEDLNTWFLLWWFLSWNSCGLGPFSFERGKLLPHYRTMIEYHCTRHYADLFLTFWQGKAFLFQLFLRFVLWYSTWCSSWWIMFVFCVSLGSVVWYLYCGMLNVVKKLIFTCVVSGRSEQWPLRTELKTQSTVKNWRVKCIQASSRMQLGCNDVFYSSDVYMQVHFVNSS